MIVKNKKNLTNGSSALAPKYSPLTHTNETKAKELEQAKKENLKINKQKKSRNKVKILRNILVGFIVAITLVYRYCYIYNMERNSMEVKQQLSSIKADNESLKVGLLKFNNIKLIEKTSQEELSMLPKSRADVMYTDLSKNNFNEVNAEQQEKSKWNVLLDKVKKILF